MGTMSSAFNFTLIYFWNYYITLLILTHFLIGEIGMVKL